MAEARDAHMTVVGSPVVALGMQGTVTLVESSRVDRVASLVVTGVIREVLQVHPLGWGQGNVQVAAVSWSKKKKKNYCRTDVSVLKFPIWMSQWCNGLHHCFDTCLVPGSSSLPDKLSLTNFLKYIMGVFDGLGVALVP